MLQPVIVITITRFAISSFCYTMSPLNRAFSIPREKWDFLFSPQKLYQLIFASSVTTGERPYFFQERKTKTGNLNSKVLVQKWW